MINCKLCKKLICKYLLDVGDTVFLPDIEKGVYICDDCAKEIAKQIIER